MTATAPGPAGFLELNTLRDRFPALRRIHAGHPVAYFDGPGGTQVPIDVADAMRDYLLHHNANTHWAFPTSEETDARILAARSALADYLGARPDEIAFGANMTTLTFHLARALGRGWGPGDEVVITELDHHANVAPWQAIARERGVTLKVVPFDPVTGELDLTALQRMLTPAVRLLAIGAASNALGTITDVTRAAHLAREAGALSFVDAVHLAAHGRVDVAAIGCDFLACSSYKFYGPHLGILFGRRELIAGLDVPKLLPAPDTPPERLETGTQNHEGIVGAHAAVEFIASLGTGPDRRARLADAGRRLHGAGQALVEQLWEGLGAIPGVKRYGPPPARPRTSTLSFTVAGAAAEQVARELAARGVFVSHGDFYAATVIQRLGLAAQGVVRAGCACYNTPEEVDRLLTAVRRIAGLPAAIP
jgi:cysteine desulfurase family protein (TIGR01976 family)